MEGILISLLIGAIAGWLAGMILKGGGQGLLMNIVIGIVGGVIGGWLFGVLGVSIGPGFVGAIISATVGAVLLLFIVSKLKK
jgi:uncharacterized membrane protein YeaQ/YmgE (transglycosylase-associated protein family)